MTSVSPYSENTNLYVISSTVQITGDANAKLDYIQYECGVVRSYHVRLVGYTHTEWANPSQIKGRINVMETLAKAVLEKMCCFVKISEEEVENRHAHISNGEILTPNVDRSPPLTTNGSSLQPGDGNRTECANRCHALNWFSAVNMDKDSRRTL